MFKKGAQNAAHHLVLSLVDGASHLVCDASAKSTSKPELLHFEYSYRLRVRLISSFEAVLLVHKVLDPDPVETSIGQRNVTRTVPTRQLI